MKKCLLLAVLLLGSLILLQRYAASRQAEVDRLKVSLAAKLASLQTPHAGLIVERDEIHQAILRDEEVISGRRAEEQHRVEWQERMAYDPKYARTPRERTILEIAEIAGDESIDAQQVLEKVAELASPRNAEVTVEEQEGAFRVKVAFDMAVMTSGEEGSRTKHSTIDSLKRETTEIIARVMKDLYDHCGKRDIEQIEVACKHGVEEWIAPGIPGPTSIIVIYDCRMSTADVVKIGNWRSVQLHTVADHLEVQHNNFPNIRIKFTTVPSYDR